MDFHEAEDGAHGEERMRLLAQHPRTSLLGLGVVSGVLSSTPFFMWVFADPLVLYLLGIFYLPGLIYGLVVLVVWARMRQSSIITQVLCIIASVGGYYVAANIVGSYHEETHVWAVTAHAAAGAVGLLVAVIPLLVTANRAILPALLASIPVAAIAGVAFSLVIGIGPDGGFYVFALRYVCAFALWQGSTAYALSFALREPRDRLACEGCGYNLRGNVSGRCPECGQALAVEQRETVFAAANE